MSKIQIGKKPDVLRSRASISELAGAGKYPSGSGIPTATPPAAPFVMTWDGTRLLWDTSVLTWGP